MELLEIWGKLGVDEDGFFLLGVVGGEGGEEEGDGEEGFSGRVGEIVQVDTC